MDETTLRFTASQVFTPSAPITRRDQFVGRMQELSSLAKACATPGGHAVLFGERGVGKTSLANVFVELMRAVREDQLAARVTCESEDSYSAIVRKLLKQIRLPMASARTAGYLSHRKEGFLRLDDALRPGEDSPEDLRFLVEQLHIDLVLVIDEVDRVSPEQRTRLADAVKVFSDTATSITVILVGVARSVDDLVSSHESTQRALSQIRVGRLDLQASREIVDRRLPDLNMEADAKIVDAVARMSQGLPHFVHLLGLETVLAGIDRGDRRLGESHLREGLRNAIRTTNQSIVRAYVDATQSPRVDAIFAKVLCACAMAETDIEGFFRPRAVLPHLRRLHGRHAKIATFMKHLNTFSTTRGPVLEQQGSRRKYRFRFRNPMMRAYVLIQAVANEEIRMEDVEYLPGQLLVT